MMANVVQRAANVFNRRDEDEKDTVAQCVGKPAEEVCFAVTRRAKEDVNFVVGVDVGIRLMRFRDGLDDGVCGWFANRGDIPLGHKIGRAIEDIASERVWGGLIECGHDFASR
jgi:hypothetical protein